MGLRLELDGGAELSLAGLEVHYYKDLKDGGTFTLVI